MLSDEEVLEAVRIRLKNGRWKDAGDALGMSVSGIYAAVYERIFAEKRARGADLYPNVRRWMLESHVSYEDLAANAGYAIATVKEQLNGRSRMSEALARTIRELSGMSEEEIRQTKETEKDE